MGIVENGVLQDRLKAQEEERLQAEEEPRLKAEEEARLKSEEEGRLQAEEEARLKDEEEARLRAQEDEARKEAKINFQEVADNLPDMDANEPDHRDWDLKILKALLPL